MSYTKGPWLIDEQCDENNNSMAIIADYNEGQCIAIVMDEQQDLKLNNYKANASLIAAAPELLDALEEILPVLRQYGGLPIKNPFKYELLIKKAKGE